MKQPKKINKGLEAMWRKNDKDDAELQKTYVRNFRLLEETGAPPKDMALEAGYTQMDALAPVKTNPAIRNAITVTFLDKVRSHRDRVLVKMDEELAKSNYAVSSQALLNLTKIERLLMGETPIENQQINIVIQQFGSND